MKLKGKVSMRWKNWRDFRVLHSDTIARRKWVEDQETILELTGEIQELQNEIVARMIQEIFKMLNQSAVDILTLPVNQCFSHLVQSWWSAKPFYRNAEPRRWAAKQLGHAWYIGKRFLQIQRRPLQHLIRRNWIHAVVICWDQRCQSGPSPQNSVIPCEGDSLNNYGADQQRLQISDPHFGKFTMSATFACWKIRFKTEVCTCSQFPTGCEDCFSTEQNHPEFSLQKRLSQEEQKGLETGPLPSRKTDRLLDLRVFPGHWSQRFCRELCRPIHYQSSKWWYSGIRFEGGWNFMINDEKSHLMTSWKDCTK